VPPRLADIRCATSVVINRGGLPTDVSFFSASRQRLDSLCKSSSPRGQYARNDPNVSSERDIPQVPSLRIRKCIDELVGLFEHVRPVLDQFLGPRQVLPLEKRLHKEQRTTQPQCFPGLREASPTIAGLDDHGCVC